MIYVIACGDEGVQINEGTRLGLVGAGVKFEGAETIISALQKVLSKDLRIVSSEENDWIRQSLNLSTWEQADASFQQRAQVVADKNGLSYAGFLPFADPKQLEHEIKGHMVRPHGIHIANKLCFTLGGGEQTFNLGNYVISAEWLSQVDFDQAKTLIQAQVDFYTKLAGQPLKVVFESAGELGADHAAKQQTILEKMGFKAT